MTTEERLARVEAFLAKRTENQAFPFDPIVDIDEGSRGHTILHESDLRALLARVKELEGAASEDS